MVMVDTPGRITIGPPKSDGLIVFLHFTKGILNTVAHCGDIMSNVDPKFSLARTGHCRYSLFSLS
jgi:hypothetical protein